MTTARSRHFLQRVGPHPDARALGGAASRRFPPAPRAGRRRLRDLAVRLHSSLAVFLIAQQELWACPVCFGQNDSPMARGTNLGVLFLLGVVGFVLASFGAFFLYLARRARLAARLPAEDPITCSNS